MKKLPNVVYTGSYPVLPSQTRIARYLGITIVLLLAFNILNIIIQNTSPSNTLEVRFLDRFFNFNGENNFPSFFSTLLLLFASMLLFFIHAQLKNNGKQIKEWFILAVIFSFLTLDENIQIHETISKFTRPLITDDLSGFLYWSWVVPYFFLLLALAVYLLRFVVALPKTTRNLFFLAAVLFVFGAMGLELIEGYVYKQYGLDHLYNQVLYCIEELLEMTGTTIFIYALLQYIHSLSCLTERFEESSEPASDRTPYLETKPV